MGDKEHHRVHFPESEDAFGKNNEIVVQGSTDGESVSIHLGFLQVGHRYQITVELPYLLCQPKESAHLFLRDCVPGKVQSVNCKINDISKTSSGFLINMELLAYKEKLLKEQLFLENSDNTSVAKLTLTLIARVLGKGKGTPMLKNGIHCIGVELEDESEASDWQGFG